MKWPEITWFCRASFFGVDVEALLVVSLYEPLSARPFPDTFDVGNPEKKIKGIQKYVIRNGPYDTEDWLPKGLRIDGETVAYFSIIVDERTTKEQ